MTVVGEPMEQKRLPLVLLFVADAGGGVADAMVESGGTFRAEQSLAPQVKLFTLYYFISTWPTWEFIRVPLGRATSNLSNHHY